MKDGKFENQREIFEALLRGEKVTCLELLSSNDLYVIFNNEGRLSYPNGQISLYSSFYNPSYWSLYQEPKPKKTIEVKFYRYHYQFEDVKIFHISEWTIHAFEKIYKNYKLLKTEERVEVYEMENE